MAVVVLVGAVVVVVLVPRLWRWAWSKIETPLSQVGDAFTTVRDTKTAITALGAALGTEILYAGGLTMCVSAMGGSVSLGRRSSST